MQIFKVTLRSRFSRKTTYCVFKYHSFLTYVPFQISMNVILTLTTVTTMPNVSTPTGHLSATVVMDFLGTE